MPAPETIKIDEIEYVRKDRIQQPKTGPVSIIRCRNAGVHAGEVIERANGVLKVRNSRRLWSWWSKATLSELAMEGPVNISENKYGCVLPYLELTDSDVAEVIATTPAAASAIFSVPVWSTRK